ncbi:type II toxin-antitoxin system CcdA family antitoxin [Escherichia coli]|uniref:type II toxin-antitoxin system CcdA family antitoxin n=1 Tax=Escherichia coli TaxID=562 RepID=UPI001FF46CC4|nr:type II toxin-antitoxin system CcdA family antitoxin [Escherichia coli]EKR7494923.1 type II toxin-antitoxin system CcdA family antitoxin [Escherichia coli]
MNDKTFEFTSERDFVSRAHCVGLNPQATLQWNEVNEDAISALNELAEETGCFSDEYRKF